MPNISVYTKPGKIYCSTFRGHRDSIIKRPVKSYANKEKYKISTEITINGLNKHLGTDGIRLHVQCWFTHSNVYKFAATFRDGVKLLNETFRHFAIVLEVIMFVN